MGLFSANPKPFIAFVKSFHAEESDRRLRPDKNLIGLAQCRFESTLSKKNRITFAKTLIRGEFGLRRYCIPSRT
jgi:hypothetical protein